jgi:molybdate transport system substrate-binding protein
MKNSKTILAAVVLFLLAATLQAAPITVFAAASLTDALQHLAADYERSSGGQVVFNFAASGVLARQIAAGAPADIFFSADEAQMDGLAAKGLLTPGTRRVLLGNALVIVTPPENTVIHGVGDLTNAAVRRIALGETKSVPAGAYARAYLEKAGVWAAVEPKVAGCENVRAVLAVVESGNADAGLVYKTDALISKKVKVVCEVPAADGPKIVYPAALIKDSAQAAAAAKFLDFLASEPAAKVFRAYGFTAGKKLSGLRHQRMRFQNDGL